MWCLRAAGETRVLPAIGIALAAVSMPAFINRYGHAALTGQFTLFLALGLYLRLVRAPSAEHKDGDPVIAALETK